MVTQIGVENQGNKFIENVHSRPCIHEMQHLAAQVKSGIYKYCNYHVPEGLTTDPIPLMSWHPIPHY